MTNFSTDQLVERTHDHLNTYITVADQKASILLTGQFAFLGLAATASSNFLNNTGLLVNFLAAATAVIGVAAMVLSIAVIYPRTPSPGDSLVYWGDIRRHKNADQYREAMAVDDTDPIDVLVEQNYALAGVANRKYCLLRWSLRITLAMITTAAASVLVYVL